MFTPLSLILTHSKLCLATATYNFKWVEITHTFSNKIKRFQIMNFLTLTIKQIKHDYSSTWQVRS